MVVLVGCSKSPTAMSVCKQLEAGGVASSCHPGTKDALSLGAAEKVEFDLPSVPSKTGQVLRFDSDEQYDKTVESFGKLRLAGPHRYASRATRIFVHVDSEVPAEVGTKAKAVVEALPGEDKSPPVSKSAQTPTPRTPGEEVCQKLVAAEAAKGCTKTESGARFLVPGVPKGTGSIVVIGDQEMFDRYVADAEASPPTSPSRPFFVSKKAKIIVHLSKLSGPEIEAKTKTVIDAL
jgi:hypothetical protein